MKIIRIIIKDVKTLLSDKKAFVVMLIMPLLLMVILSSALRGSFAGGGTGVMSKVSIAIVKQYDRELDLQRFKETISGNLFAGGMGEKAVAELRTAGEEVDPEKLFFEEFMGNEEVEKIVEYRLEEVQKAEELLEAGNVSAVVVLPENFVFDMKMNLLTPFRNKLEIKVLTHPDKSISGQVVQSIMEAYTDTMTSVIIGKNVLIEASMEQELNSDGFGGMKAAMDGISEVLEDIRVNIDSMELQGRRQTTSADYYSVAMLTMFILFAAGHGGRLLLEEKENITYQRMIMAGTPRLGIMAGKFVMVFLIAMLQIGIMIAFSYFVLGVQWGSMTLVLLISLSAAFAVAGIGVALAAATFRAGNYKMANVFENVIIQIMAFLGGSFFPVDIMPSILQRLSIFSVNGVALKAYLKVMKGYGIAEVVRYAAVLSAVGALFAIMSVLILRERGGLKNA